MKGQQLIATILERFRQVPIRIWLTPDDELKCSCGMHVCSKVQGFSKKGMPEQACCPHIGWLYGNPDHRRLLRDARVTVTPRGHDEFDWRLAARQLVESAR